MEINEGGAALMEKLMSRLDDVILWLTESAKTEIPPFIEEAYRWWVIRDTVDAMLLSMIALLSIILGVICHQRFHREPRRSDYAAEQALAGTVISACAGFIFILISIISWMDVIKALVAPKLYILSNLKSILY